MGQVAALSCSFAHFDGFAVHRKDFTVQRCFI